MSTRTVKVPNISCGHCVSTIEREVGLMSGVNIVDASEENREVRVEWDEDTTSWAEIVQRLEAINYPPAAS